MKIQELDEFSQYEYTPSFEQNVKEQFPNLYKKDYGFAQPGFKLHDCLRGVWLNWHRWYDLNRIHETFKPAVERAIVIASDPKIFPHFRGNFDNFLIQLAVIVGDIGLMEKAAMSVEDADDESKKYQMYESWTGIIKYRILGDEKNVKRQHEIFQRYSIVKYYVYPTKKMIKTFVEKDYNSLLKVIKQRSEKYWEWGKNALSEEDGEQILDPKKLHPNFFWPWVECTFAKLAIMDGAEYTHDSPWLPVGLIKDI